MAKGQGIAGGTGARDWQALATVGDVRRMLRFCILEVKRGRLAIRKANCMGFLANQLLACIEAEEFEQRIAKLEADQGLPSNEGHSLSITVNQ